MELKHLDQLTPVSTIDSEDAVVGIFNSDINIATVEGIAEKAGDILITRKAVATPNSVAQAIADAEDAKPYGVCINHTTASPTLERLGAAVGLKAEVATGNNAPVNDFDNVYPYSEMRKCTLADNGTITAYEGEPTYVEDGSIGQVMVEIPKFYIRRFIDTSADKEYIYICKKKLAGYVLPKCFYDKNGNEIDYVYIAAYPSAEDEDGKAQSVAGKANNDIDLYLSAYYMESIEARKGYDKETKEYAYPAWHGIDIHELNMLQMLFMVEFATTNSESLFTGMYDNYASSNVAIDASAVSQSTNSFTSEESLSNGDIVFPGAEITIELAVDYDIATEEGAVKTEYEFEGVTHFFWTVKRRVVSVADTATTRTITISGSAVALDEFSTFGVTGYRTGCTNVINAKSGNLIAATEDTAGRIPFKWRGIENLFSYKCTWVSGILISTKENGGRYCVTDNQKLYGDMSSIGDYDIGVACPATGYIAKMTYDVDNPLLMLAEATDATDASGTDSTGYCDRAQITINRVLKCYNFGGGSVGVGGVFFADTYPTKEGYVRLAYHHY